VSWLAVGTDPASPPAFPALPEPRVSAWLSGDWQYATTARAAISSTQPAAAASVPSGAVATRLIMTARTVNCIGAPDDMVPVVYETTDAVVLAALVHHTRSTAPVGLPRPAQRRHRPPDPTRGHPLTAIDGSTPAPTTATPPERAPAATSRPIPRAGLDHQAGPGERAGPVGARSKRTSRSRTPSVPHSPGGRGDRASWTDLGLLTRLARLPHMIEGSEHPVGPAPEGNHTLVTFFTVHDCANAIEFYREVLGAELVMRLNAPDGTVVHAEMALGDSRFQLADTQGAPGVLGPPADGNDFTMTFWTADVDRTCAKAVDNGATVMVAPEDSLSGDRRAVVRCPFGVRWCIARHDKDVSVEKIQAAITAWMSSQGS
jgi:PhnB protein